MNQEPIEFHARDLEPIKNYAIAVYALQALAFVLGVTYLIAVIIAHIKRAEARGTWLDSHYRWQIRTFWYSLLWSIVGLISSLILIGYVLLLATSIWVIYRIVKGWMYLADGRAMY